MYMAHNVHTICSMYRNRYLTTVRYTTNQSTKYSIERSHGTDVIQESDSEWSWRYSETVTFIRHGSSASNSIGAVKIIMSVEEDAAMSKKNREALQEQRKFFKNESGLLFTYWSSLFFYISNVTGTMQR